VVTKPTLPFSLAGLRVKTVGARIKVVCPPEKDYEGRHIPIFWNTSLRRFLVVKFMDRSPNGKLTVKTYDTDGREYVLLFFESRLDTYTIDVGGLTGGKTINDIWVVCESYVPSEEYVECRLRVALVGR